MTTLPTSTLPVSTVARWAPHAASPTRWQRVCGRPALLAMVVSLAACSGYAPPKPWEKGKLAKPEMTMASDPLQQRFDEHIYFSKEAASGGYGVGGGGCGCN